MFWLKFLPFYQRLSPIFAPANNLRDNVKLFGDVQTFNVTDIYQSTFAPEGVLILLVQNFLNFFVNTFFWLTYIPFYERITPIFLQNKTDTNDAEVRLAVGFNTEGDSHAPKSVELPNFNVTSIYYNTFSPGAIATQLLQVFISSFLFCTVTLPKARQF